MPMALDDGKAASQGWEEQPQFRQKRCSLTLPAHLLLEWMEAELGGRCPCCALTQVQANRAEPRTSRLSCEVAMMPHTAQMSAPSWPTGPWPPSTCAPPAIASPCCLLRCPAPLPMPMPGPACSAVGVLTAAGLLGWERGVAVPDPAGEVAPAAPICRACRRWCLAPCSRHSRHSTTTSFGNVAVSFASQPYGAGRHQEVRNRRLRKAAKDLDQSPNPPASYFGAPLLSRSSFRKEEKSSLPFLPSLPHPHPYLQVVVVIVFII